MFEVKLSKQAVKFLKRLNEPQYSNVNSKLKSLIQWPLKNKDVKSMKGLYRGYYRMRVGKIRIIFYPDIKNNIIYVDAVGFRGGIYR